MIRLLVRLLKYVILFCICLLAIIVRLTPVLKYEAMIHEYDPYFNYRVTKYLINHGKTMLFNWFDERSWYPLGRDIGHSIHPGLMWTSAVIFWILDGLHVPITIRLVCIWISPLFAALSCIVVYLMTIQITNSNDVSVGLFAAFFMAIVPAYLSRSVAGSYDYESVAIFAILLTLYLWIRSLATTQTMPMLASCLCALSFYYLVACWGGFVLVSNLIPLHVATLIAVNKYSSRVYISYSIFYVVGTLLALTVPIVGFNAIHHAEALASHLVFILVQVLECFESVKPLIRNVWKAKLNSSQKNQLLKLYYGCWYFVIALVCGAVCMIYRGKVVQLTTRVATLFKPLVSVLTPMSNVPSPLVASVSEHQPALWTTFFLDLHLLWILAPIGWILCFEALVDVASTPNALMYSEGIIFLTLFGAVAWYFAGAMVRLMLILAPVACMLSAVTTSKLLTLCIRTIFQYFSRSSLQTSIYLRIHTGIYVMLLCFTYLAILVFGFHASYISSVVYSSPSVIVNVGTTPTGAAVLYDDFREMYSWIRHNTPDNAKIMAWWDYGYQLAAMGNRTTIVDGNTWNSTHIATVGKVLISNEEEALPLLHKMGIDYVLVVFGGVSGYGSDDINKFLWPVRISGNNENSSINMEAIYLNDKNQFDVGENASIALQSSVTYKLCYHNFDKISTVFNEPKGYDRARNVVVSGAKNIHLDIFEEAYTTSHWMMRLYAVKEKPNSNRIVEMSKHKKNGLTVKTRNKKT